ncbi:NUDIX hydrolase [Oopsacas minuta]|uniref:NUDIX hydrolase n=1 Tax=Oopsacas minuta TaxID=111878 RepID=A0AAV7K744_9METZ|nr:NUDIX hydrolase [Oopsacas minuta]
MAKAEITNPHGLSVKTVKCFGIIPVRFQDANCELFIVQQRAGHWGFPKGHPEPQDKTEFESACRELKEECNLEVKRVLFEDTITDKYMYVKKDVIKDKTVQFWIAEIANPAAVKLQEAEILDGKWVPVNEVYLKFTKEHSQQTLKKILDMIKTF